MSDQTTADLLKAAQAQLEKVSSEFSKKAEAALKEAQNSGKLSQETKEEVDRLALTFNTLTQGVEALKAQLGELEQHVVSMPGNAKAGAGRETAGSITVNAEAVINFAKALEGGKRISVAMPRAALISTDVAEGVVEPMRLPGIDIAPKQRLFVRDLIMPGQTAAPAIFWVQMTGFTNAAAPVSENPVAGKPYSDIAFDTKVSPVKTIAHMFKASKQIMDDFRQLQSTIDGEMRYGLKYVEEQQMLFGDGTGNNLEGIVPQASQYNPAFSVPQQTGIDDLRLAMLQAQLARVPSSGHVLHFIDWAKIELAKDSLGRYILANPASLTGPVLWGLPVIPTEIAAFQGKFLTGAFSTAAQVFDREEANVVISTENADDFEKNMISIRCEERLALTVKRPEGFVFGEFTAPVVSSN
jgi:HK97 family phage major capsid protein